MIYFIANEEQQIVKIGYTKENPILRLANIQIGNPYLLNMICVIDGEISDERQLHKDFEHLRLQGEWFTLNNEIKSLIDKYNDGDCYKNYITNYTKDSVKQDKSIQIKLNLEKPDDLCYADYGRLLHLITMLNKQNIIAYNNGRVINRKVLMTLLDFKNIKSFDNYIKKLCRNNILFKKKKNNSIYYLLNPDMIARLQ